MTKLKRLSALAVALCALIVCVFAFAACSAPDYSTYTYDDFAAMTDKDWDKKTISYQFVSATSPDGAIDVSVPESHNIYLINLYADGTMLIWQAGLQFSPAAMKDAAWFDEDRHITWAYFGLWTTAENGDIDMYYLTLATANYAKDNNLDPVTVETTADWASIKEFKFHYTAKKSGDNYVITQTDGTNDQEQFWYLGVNLNAENFSVPFESWTSTSGSAIKYGKLQDFVDMYMVDEEFWTEF